MNFCDFVGDCICEIVCGNINLIVIVVLSYLLILVNKNLVVVFMFSLCFYKINKEKWRMYLLDKNNLF